MASIERDAADAKIMTMGRVNSSRRAARSATAATAATFMVEASEDELDVHLSVGKKKAARRRTAKPKQPKGETSFCIDFRPQYTEVT